MAYVGDGGRTALRLSSEYDLLLTQRLVLQPALELNVYGEDDLERLIGAGLSDMELGLRLRYEIRREIAPYVGVNWLKRFGDTADLARAAGEDDDEFGLVAGIRLWF
jgi:copper resistance protein B